MTSATPVVWPHWLVPPPRASTGTPRSRAIASALMMSRSLVGTSTPTGDDLVDRRIGGIAAARTGVEQYFALGFLAQPHRQRVADIVVEQRGAGRRFTGRFSRHRIDAENQGRAACG